MSSMIPMGGDGEDGGFDLKKSLPLLLAFFAARRSGPSAVRGLMAGYNQGQEEQRKRRLQQQQMGMNAKQQANENALAQRRIGVEEGGLAIDRSKLEASLAPIPIPERLRPYAGGLTMAIPAVYNANYPDWERAATNAEREDHLKEGMNYLGELQKPEPLPADRQPISVGPFPPGQEPKDVTDLHQTTPLEFIKLMLMLGKGGMPSEGLTSLATQMERPLNAAKVETEHATRPGKVRKLDAEGNLIEAKTNLTRWQMDNTAKGSPAWKAVESIKVGMANVSTRLKAIATRASRGVGSKGYSFSQAMDDVRGLQSLTASLQARKAGLLLEADYQGADHPDTSAIDNVIEWSNQSASQLMQMLPQTQNAPPGFTLNFGGVPPPPPPPPPPPSTAKGKHGSWKKDFAGLPPDLRDWALKQRNKAGKSDAWITQALESRGVKW